MPPQLVCNVSTLQPNGNILGHFTTAMRHQQLWAQRNPIFMFVHLLAGYWDWLQRKLHSRSHTLIITNSFPSFLLPNLSDANLVI